MRYILSTIVATEPFVLARISKRFCCRIWCFHLRPYPTVISFFVVWQDFLLKILLYHENFQPTENTIEQLFHDLEKDKNTELDRLE